MKHASRWPSTVPSGHKKSRAVSHRTEARASMPQPGYPWLRPRLSRAQGLALLVGVALVVALALLYHSYAQGAEVAPDSVYGLAFAMSGTLLLIVVGAGYALRKHWATRWPGRLYPFLLWHSVGGCLGLLLIWMHTAGSFEQSSGLYTFYGLLGVVGSGLIGRVLDYVCPRLAARAALQAVMAGGEKRLEALAVEAASRSFRRGGRRLRAIEREAGIIEQATQRERRFLWMIRAWRQAHLLVSLGTVGLLIWHLVSVAPQLFQAS